MAPLRKPITLQRLCLNKTRDLYMKFVLRLGENIYSEEARLVMNYTMKFIPHRFMAELFHSSLTLLSKEDIEQFRPHAAVLLMNCILPNDVTELNFSDLALAGSTSYENLDTFEELLSYYLRLYPCVKKLDLSTHRTESSYPSCSYFVLKTIGLNLSNLRILDLNHNNRVTGDGLFWLAPSRSHTGCPHLEKIFLQDCSVTRNDIMWLILTFKKLKKVGYPDMGTILQMIKTKFRKERRMMPTFQLTSIDNSESTQSTSDYVVMRLIQATCPYVNNIRVRVEDSDATILREFNSLKKLELRFYTGVHHPIGPRTYSYINDMGSILETLTIYCDVLESFLITTIASSCCNLKKLFLHGNVYQDSDDGASLIHTSNGLSQLQVLSLRIGMHEMDTSVGVDNIALYLIGSCFQLEEIFLLAKCPSLNSDFLQSVFSRNPLNFLKLLICDAPRRNVNFAY